MSHALVFSGRHGGPIPPSRRPSCRTQSDQNRCYFPNKVLGDRFIIEHREASRQRCRHCFHESDNPKPLDRLRRAESQTQSLRSKHHIGSLNRRIRQIRRRCVNNSLIKPRQARRGTIRRGNTVNRSIIEDPIIAQTSDSRTTRPSTPSGVLASSIPLFLPRRIPLVFIITAAVISPTSERHRSSRIEILRCVDIEFGSGSENDH